MDLAYCVVCGTPGADLCDDRCRRTASDWLDGLLVIIVSLEQMPRAAQLRGECWTEAALLIAAMETYDARETT